MMMVETVARADASLMNIFGLQDIAMTIEKFGDEDQKKEFLPKFTTGEYTGAMALTEPDAGSDLQAVKLHAYQDDSGNWFLRGVKRFITNGSPTAELQFNDTPAVLIGKRKFGLIKYVMDLMNSARLGVSAQALGISQASYEEAVKYAREREQFGQPIINIPAVTNILIDMRVTLETNRSLFYATSKWVDLRNQLEENIEKLKSEDKSVSDENIRFRNASKVCDLLTPMTKYVLTESSNKISYDALQVHGGAGYMKDFIIERLTRDARITNIYEGTSQLQIVAATGGVINDLLKDHFDQKEQKKYKGTLTKLANYLKEIREIFYDCLKYVVEKKDPHFQEITAKDLVELYTFLYVGYLVLEEAEISKRKIFIANRYITSALSLSRKNAESIKNDQYQDVLHADEILV